MTRAEEIARKVFGFKPNQKHCPTVPPELVDDVAAAMELFAKEERERCARLVEREVHDSLNGARVAARIREGIV